MFYSKQHQDRIQNDRPQVRLELTTLQLMVKHLSSIFPTHKLKITTALLCILTPLPHCLCGNFHFYFFIQSLLAPRDDNLAAQLFLLWAQRRKGQRRRRRRATTQNKLQDEANASH